MYRLCGGATLGCCMGCGVLYCDGVLPIEEPLLKPYVTSLGQQTAPPAAVVHHLQCQGLATRAWSVLGARSHGMKKDLTAYRCTVMFPSHVRRYVRTQAVAPFAFMY